MIHSNMWIKALDIHVQASVRNGALKGKPEMDNQEVFVGIVGFIAGLTFMIGYIVGAVIVMWHNHRTIHESPIYFR